LLLVVGLVLGLALAPEPVLAQVSVWALVREQEWVPGRGLAWHMPSVRQLMSPKSVKSK